MRLAGLDTWRPAPGRLVRIAPTPASAAAAAAAPVHAGPPSYLQADHLRAYAALAARGGTHRAWTGVATTLDGPLEAAALCRALERFLARHEGMRTWFDLGGVPDGGAPVRHLVPAADVALEAQPLEGPAGDGSAGDEEWQDAVHRLLVDLFTETCRPDAWPGFALVVVEGPDSFGLVWACDHAFTDAASQIMLAAELGALYEAEAGRGADPAPEPPEPAAPSEPVGSFLAHVAAERAAGEEYDAGSPEVAGWVSSVAAHGGLLPRFPLDLGLAPGETAPVRLRSADLLTGAEVEALDRVCAAAGARTTGGVFAALGATERALTGVDDQLLLTVLGTRRGEHVTAQGWYCTFGPVDFSLAGLDGFGAAAAAAQAGFERAKRLGRAPVPLVLETLVRSGTTPAESLGSPQLVSFLDLRWFPGVGTPGHDRGLHFTGEGRTGNASMWVNRDAERLHVVAQTPDTAEAAAAVTRYFEVLREVLVAATHDRLLEPAGARHDR
ncbi:hypothetical protein GGQ22_05770 [Nocardioides sp. zg-579]|uniref:Condensation domain-containing protein n=1 Tax=Nocardioides marmotae TaxID=2663857 RepID=A0A6I3IVX8_9ACTN|nr:hypothetical protein [Nocardioides marmotae]MCR6030947.1 hypothetical protein [Gordonia jinghuaiqii]MTB94583.1 hypothetical protein [Nocardioides marmotae]QKE01406.1 hypothetical protein HPC71_10215 [Nocardioides marmotae]